MSYCSVSAYTGYRRSIGDVLETSSGTTTASSTVKSTEPMSIDEANQKLTTTATIIAQNMKSTQEQNIIPSPTIPAPTPAVVHYQAPTAIVHHQAPPTAVSNNEQFIRHEQQQQQAPQPAPRTRLSSQNSIPMTNGDGAKADDAAQVRRRST